ncbi:MAG: hypothetical protein IRZ16_18160 [Myxococcaceae bacterium]|nr:hypothetical protein [Myxococcaceae bacterium]
MDFRDYVERFDTYTKIARISRFAEVQEGGRTYPLLCAETDGRHRLVITSGFHGEEPAGPLTLLTRFEEIAQWARAHDVGLQVYPCINPSGFEDGTRYNRSGEKPNNDFLRYEVAPGVWKSELQPGEPFLRWALFDGGPKETRALRAELEKHPRPNAALDIHQDRYVHQPLSYAYVFGDRAAYAPLVEAASRYATIARDVQVDEVNRTNALGLIEYNDGSVTDYYLRRQVPYTAALETTTSTPLERAHEVNLIWIRGFIELAARGE